MLSQHHILTKYVTLQAVSPQRIPLTRLAALPRAFWQRKKVATDVDSENGPMSLLRQNVTANCRYRGRRAARVSPITDDPLSRIPPPRVRELRWGDEAQLVDVLSEFGGVGPDVVLA